MGCDIHAFVEARNGAARWKCISELHIERSYALFGALALVRYPHPEGLEPRGLPVDSSFVVKDRYRDWGSDAHTPSYVSREEFENALTLLEWEWQDEWAVVAMMKHMEASNCLVRLVFWFDN